MFKNKYQQIFELSLIKVILSNRYLIFSILLSSAVPIIMMQLYFQMDDSIFLRWATEFDKPFYYAFSPSPEINQLGTNYRPFIYLSYMALHKIFGNSPLFYQLIGGLMFIGVIIFMFKITELLSNEKAAFFSVILLLGCFNSSMTTLAHVGYPFGYFFQIGSFYFCMLWLLRNKRRYFVLLLVFLLFGTSRATTPVLIFSVMLSYYLSNWRTIPHGIGTKLFNLSLVLSPAVVIAFSLKASKPTILDISLEFLNIINFLTERLFFYGDMLTTGITGISLISIIFLYLALFIRAKIGSLFCSDKRCLLLLIPVSIILSYVMTQLGNVSVFIFFIALGLCFWLNKTLRYPLTWFFVSLSCFLIPQYYVGGYLLESAYGLCIAIGILLYFIFNEININFEVNYFMKANSKIKSFVIILIVAFSITIFFKIERIPFVSEKFTVAKVLINTNDNFKDMMDYLVKNLPHNSVVYEISETDLKATRFESRFFSLEKRAAKKVMNIPRKQAMIGVLGRKDIIFKASSEIPEWNSEGSRYFIVNNKSEKNIAEKNYSLKLIKSIKRGETIAAIYALQ